MGLPFLSPRAARTHAGNERYYDASSDLVCEAPVEHPFGPGYIISNLPQENEEERREEGESGQGDVDEVRIAKTDYILKKDKESKDHFKPHQDYIPFDSPSDGEQSDGKIENVKENNTENLKDNEGRVDYILMVKTSSRPAQREEECDYIPLDVPTQETATPKLDTRDSSVKYIRPKKITKFSAQGGKHDYLPLDMSPKESPANSIEDSGYVSISENVKNQKPAEPILRAPSESSDGTASTIPAIPRPRRPVRHRMICDNCSQVGHRYMQCIKPCLLCGNPKHRSPECQQAIQQKEKNEQKSSSKKRKVDENSEAERIIKRVRVSIEGGNNVDEGLRDGGKIKDLHNTGADNGEFWKTDGIAESLKFYPRLKSTAQKAEASKRSRKRGDDYDDEDGDSGAPTKRARLSNEGQIYNAYPGYSIYRGGYNAYPGSRAAYQSGNLLQGGYNYQPFVNSGAVGYTYSSYVPYPEYGFQFVQEGRARGTGTAPYPTYTSYNTRPQATHGDGYFSYGIGNEQEIRDVKPGTYNFPFNLRRSP
jgi:hypothetical protein